MSALTKNSQTEAEVLCRAYAQVFDTPAVRRAILLAEAGVLTWIDIARIFGRAYADAIAEDESAAVRLEHDVKDRLRVISHVEAAAEQRPAVQPFVRPVPTNSEWTDADHGYGDPDEEM